MYVADDALNNKSRGHEEILDVSYMQLTLIFIFPFYLFMYVTLFFSSQHVFCNQPFYYLYSRCRISILFLFFYFLKLHFYLALETPLLPKYNTKTDVALLKGKLHLRCFFGFFQTKRFPQLLEVSPCTQYDDSSDLGLLHILIDWLLLNVQQIFMHIQDDTWNRLF